MSESAVRAPSAAEHEEMSTQAQAAESGGPAGAWLLPAGVMAALVCLLYAPVAGRLVAQWWQDPEYGHGFLVPLFAGYLLWTRRARCLTAPRAPSNWGLLVILASTGLLVAGTLGAELFLTRLSLVVLLAGLVLFFAGRHVLRATAFPLGFLVLMIPLPGVVYNQLTFPLQLLASRLAAACLEALQLPVLREGNILWFSSYSLEVVEACSGVRSLMSLVVLAVAYGCLLERRRWLRAVLVALMLPIAVASNALRVVATGVLSYFYGPQSADSFLHLFSGWLIFLVALAMLLSAHWLLVAGARLYGRRSHA